MALPKSDFSQTNLLSDQDQPKQTSRLWQWEHFDRREKRNKSHFGARCKACFTHNVEVVVNGTSRDMDSHLLSCKHVLSEVKLKVVSLCGCFMHTCAPQVQIAAFVGLLEPPRPWNKCSLEVFLSFCAWFMSS